MASFTRRPATRGTRGAAAAPETTRSAALVGMAEPIDMAPPITTGEPSAAAATASDSVPPDEPTARVPRLATSRRRAGSEGRRRRPLTVRARIVIAVSALAVAFELVGVVAVASVRAVMVGSPAYAEIAAMADLGEGVRPPSQDLAQALNAAMRLATTDDPGERARLGEQLQVLGQAWRDEAARGPLGTEHVPALGAAVATSLQVSTEFFDIVDEQLLEAVGSQPPQLAKAERIVQRQLVPRYDEQREAVAQVVARADAEQARLLAAATEAARTRQFGISVALAAALALGGLLGVWLVRTVVVPLRRLGESVREASERSLRATVMQATELPLTADLPTPPRVATGSGDEIDMIAVACDELQDTGLSLAVHQSRAGRATSEMVSNLARHNQTVLARAQELVAAERDGVSAADRAEADTLQCLLARSYRDCDSVLVVAAGMQPHRWTQDAEVADLVAFACGQLEGHDRVEIGAMAPARIAGQSVADVVHLLCEIVENALAYSPPVTTVSITGVVRASGYELTVLDEGIGMTPDACFEANRRIAGGVRGDLVVSPLLGMHIIGRLAARHGLVVQLDQRPDGRDGLRARVVLPTTLLVGVQRPADAPRLPYDEPWSLVPADDAAPEMLPEAGAVASVDADLPQRTPGLAPAVVIDTTVDWPAAHGESPPTPPLAPVFEPAFEAAPEPVFEPVFEVPPVAAPFAAEATPREALPWDTTPRDEVAGPPTVVRSPLDDFQIGVARGRGLDATDSGRTAAFPEPEAARTAVPAEWPTATDDPFAAGRTPAPGAAALPRRVQGASLDDFGPVRAGWGTGPGPAPEPTTRDADAVRASLTTLQGGLALGREMRSSMRSDEGDA